MHFLIHADPHTNFHNPSGPVKSFAESAGMISDWRTHWIAHGFGYWAASILDDPESVIGFGGVALKRLDGEDRLNIYFRFSTQVWGQGFATELGRCAIGLRKDADARARVYGLVRPDNAPSRRVLERLEMAPVGLLDDVEGARPSVIYATNAVQSGSE